eukprot:755913-Hanusia_phi.AAC.2
MMVRLMLGQRFFRRSRRSSCVDLCIGRVGTDFHQSRKASETKMACAAWLMCCEADGRDHANVSCYAWGRDYHDILEGKLKELATWLHETAGGVGKWYVDTGALMERDLGERAGLGFVGKNTLLIGELFEQRGCSC